MKGNINKSNMQNKGKRERKLRKEKRIQQIKKIIVHSLIVGFLPIDSNI